MNTPAPNVRIGQWGKIVSGDSAGSYVMIEDDKDATGGFLIITFTPASSSTKAVGYDNWVENREDVIEYFEQAQWQIDWTVAPPK